MKPAGKFSIILVTAPNLKTARKLAQAALQARLVACANLLPHIESHYWWQEKIQRGREVLILFKTGTSRVKELEQLILAQHPYDTPEIVSLRLDRGTARYLKWITASLPPGAKAQSAATITDS